MQQQHRGKTSLSRLAQTSAIPLSRAGERRATPHRACAAARRLVRELVGSQRQVRRSVRARLPRGLEKNALSLWQRLRGGTRAGEVFSWQGGGQGHRITPLLKGPDVLSPGPTKSAGGLESLCTPCVSSGWSSSKVSHAAGLRCRLFVCPFWTKKAPDDSSGGRPFVPLIPGGRQGSDPNSPYIVRGEGVAEASSMQRIPGQLSSVPGTSSGGPFIRRQAILHHGVVVKGKGHARCLQRDRDSNCAFPFLGAPVSSQPPELHSTPSLAFRRTFTLGAAACLGRHVHYPGHFHPT